MKSNLFSLHKGDFISKGRKYRTKVLVPLRKLLHMARRLINMGEFGWNRQFVEWQHGNKISP